MQFNQPSGIEIIVFISYEVTLCVPALEVLHVECSKSCVDAVRRRCLAIVEVEAVGAEYEIVCEIQKNMINLIQDKNSSVGETSRLETGGINPPLPVVRSGKRPRRLGELYPS